MEKLTSKIKRGFIIAGLSTLCYVSAIERGAKIPRLETFIRIANALNVPSDLLLIDVLKAGNVIKSSELSEKINDNINGHIYHPIVKEYIIPERKL